MAEINACRATFPGYYIRVLAYDARLGRQTTALHFLVQRPADEPGFLLTRAEGQDRQQTYAVHSYSTSRAADRYGTEHR